MATSPSSSHAVGQLLGIALAAVAVKSAFVLAALPSMWVWGDEMLHYVSAWDWCHLGRPGVPHPDFLYYPPLTSWLIAPVHLAGWTGPAAYQAALILLNVVQAAGAVAVYLVAHEVFDLRSRTLFLLLLVAPPAASGFALMSETPFVALFAWVAYFLVRQLRTGRARYAVLGGLCIGLAVLTRKVGLGLLGAVAVLAAVDLLWRRDRRGLGLHALAGATAVAVWGAWKLIQTTVFDARYGYYGPAGYLENGILPAFESLGALLSLARRFLASLGYPSLSTWGVAIPLVVWYCARPADPGDGGRRGLVRSLAAYLLSFMVLAGLAAAAHMFVNRHDANPRYLLYGRYMSYFAPLLIALGFGILALGVRWRRPERRAFLVLVAVVSTGVALVVPPAFFADHSGDVSNLGIAWLIAAAGESAVVAALVGVGSALLLASVVVSPLFADRTGARTAVAAAVLALAIANLALGASWISATSRSIDRSFRAYSDFVSAHGSLFEGGLFVEASSWNGGDTRDRLLVQRLVVDHVDKVVIGPAASRDPRRPYLTRVEIDGRLLFRLDGSANRIYAPAEDGARTSR